MGSLSFEQNVLLSWWPRRENAVAQTSCVADKWADEDQQNEWNPS